VLEVTAFDSEDLPVADRFEAWRQLLNRTHAPMELTSSASADYRAKLRQLSLGGSVLWPATFPDLTFLRTPRLVRQSDPENCHLSLLLQGHAVSQWDRAEAVLRPLDFHTNHTSVPYVVRSRGGPIDMIGVEVPRAELGLPWDRVEKVIGQGLSAHDGIGTLLAQFLTQVSRETDAYGPADGPRLGRVLTELVTALFARALDAEQSVQPEARNRTLLLEVKAFIRRHLHETQLTPSSVAAAHHISRSLLYRLFQADGSTVAGYIRSERLEAARRELADASRAGVPIRAIAARYGFKDHATFTRSFHAAHGASPRDYRHAAHAHG
jgi:AraC-like DNA-binding protein